MPGAFSELLSKARARARIVLVQLRDATDSETGQRYPVNPDFEPIVLTGADEDELQVIAEMVKVLGG